VLSSDVHRIALICIRTAAVEISSVCQQTGNLLNIEHLNIGQSSVVCNTTELLWVSFNCSYLCDFFFWFTSFQNYSTERLLRYFSLFVCLYCKLNHFAAWAASRILLPLFWRAWDNTVRSFLTVYSYRKDLLMNIYVRSIIALWIYTYTGSGMPESV
jgi:hypothetical protein